MLIFPDPAYPDSFYYVDVARALARGPRPQRRLRLDLRRGRAASSRPTAVLPIPSNAHWLPLASFIQVPFIAAHGPDGDRLGAADGPHRVAGRAADLGDRARRRGVARRSSWAPACWRPSRRPAPCSWPSPRTSRSSSRSWPATLWLAARGLRGEHARRTRRPGLLVGLASIARNDAFLLGAAGRPRVRHRPRPCLAARRRPTLPLAAAVGCIALYLLVVVPWWYPPADGLRIDLADGLDRHRAVAHRVPPVEQHHRRHLALEPSSPRARRHRRQPRSAGSWRRRQLRGHHRVARPRPVHGLGRLAPATLGRLPAVVPLRRDPVRRARRSSSRSTSRAARSSTRRSGWGRTPTSSRSRAWRPSSSRSRDGARRGTRPRRRGSSRGPWSASSSSPALLFAPVVQAGWTPIATPRIALAAELDRLRGAGDRPPDVDRRGRVQVLHGPWWRRLAGRPDRHDPRRWRTPTTSAGSSSSAADGRGLRPVLIADERPAGSVPRRSRSRRRRRSADARALPGLHRRRR